MSRVVLVTGVSRDLGGRFARALAASGDREVIGVDVTPPRHELGGARYVRSDLRSPVLARVIAHHQVDTIVHAGLVERAQSRAAAKESNVLGTMQLLAAAQKASSLTKFVLLSSGAIYGSGSLDPARLTEEMAGRHTQVGGFARDLREVEGYLADLAVRRRDVVTTTLRPAPMIGAGVKTPLSGWLLGQVVLRPAGFDARTQLIHPADVIAALETVTLHDHPGTFNIAPDDVLTLGQILGVLGRVSVPLPAALTAQQGRTPDEVAWLRWGRVLDSSRFVEATGVRPHYSSRRTLEEFAALTPPGVLSSERLDRAVEVAGTRIAQIRGELRGRS